MTDVRSLRDAEPAVGETYLVPVVRVRSGRCAGQAYPVLSAAPHADPELGNDASHFHLDYRFVDFDELRDWGFDPKLLEAWYRFNAAAIRADLAEVEVGREPRVCRRAVPRDAARWAAHGIDYAGARPLRLPLDCLRCPHKGTYLGNAPRTAGGHYWCPAHGLKFHRETGEVLTAE